MFSSCRAVLSAVAALALVGCAVVSPNQPLKRDVAKAIHPVDVKVGIRQPELYGNFEPSTAGQTAAIACGAVPGLGILLAAACGGAAGAMDASINASRAKAADEMIRPLKDELIEFKFDQQMNESVSKALQNVKDVRFADVAVTKVVTDQEYEKTFKASNAGALMFINMDYRMSTDLTTFEMSARGLIYPRSATARTAAGLPAELVSVNQESIMALSNSSYRASVIYSAKLSKTYDEPAAYVAAWKADNGKLLRQSLNDGIAQVSRLLAEDLQRSPETPPVAALSQIDLNNQKVDVIADGPAGQLLRFPNGALHLRVTLPGPTPMAQNATAPVAAPVAAAR